MEAVGAEAERAALEERRRRGLRPNAPAYGDTPLLSVGKEVRVQVGDAWRRAAIDCYDEDVGTVDVTFAATTLRRCGAAAAAEGEDEGADPGAAQRALEATLPATAVRAFEEFEVLPKADAQRSFEQDPVGAAAKAKECGNAVFKLRDFEAAAELYSLAIDALARFEGAAVSEAASGKGGVVIANYSGALVLGAVRSADSKGCKADVAVCASGSDKVQVVRGVPWRTLIRLHLGDLQLQSSLYMNRARCFKELGWNQEAAQDLSVVIRLWDARDARTLHLLGCSPGSGARPGGRAAEEEAAAAGERREQLLKALYLRAQTRLARFRIGSAREDVKEAWALGPPEATGRLLRELEARIDRAQQEQLRSNKRIAKEIAKFADAAMSGLDTAQLAALGQVG